VDLHRFRGSQWSVQSEHWSRCWFSVLKMTLERDMMAEPRCQSRYEDAICSNASTVAHLAQTTPGTIRHNTL
jgi:hypothetical protein